MVQTQKLAADKLGLVLKGKSQNAIYFFEGGNIALESQRERESFFRLSRNIFV